MLSKCALESTSEVSQPDGDKAIQIHFHDNDTIAPANLLDVAFSSSVINLERRLGVFMHEDAPLYLCPPISFSRCIFDIRGRISILVSRVDFRDGDRDAPQHLGWVIL